MENKKEKIEDFKTAISSTVRSLSNSEKIEVSFGNENPKSEKNSIRLPDLNQINNKINLLKTILNYWNKFYGWIFYLISIAFGLIHILNFEPSLNIYLLAPVLVAPQILIGINLGYLRIRFGLIWSILFHAFYNGILISIALLSGEI